MDVRTLFDTTRSARSSQGVKRSRAIVLSIAISDGVPPNEFRLFSAGKVETSKGEFLFDEKAAASVMADYEKHGAEIMVDYDHASLASLVVDPSLSARAAGWCSLEVRDGELWAVNVRWVESAASQLAAKEWRYMSPAFVTDADGRITSLINVALTNIPATHGLAPLVAASLKGESMNPEMMKKILEIIASGDEKAALALLPDLVTGAASEESAEAPVEEAPSDPEAMAAEPTVEDDKNAAVAATSRLARLTGKADLLEALSEVESWRASHVELSAERKKLATERAALELGQRIANAKKLQLLGAETPATSGLSTGKLCDRLMVEPLDEQTKRVEALTAARGGKLPTEPRAADAKDGASSDQSDGSKTFETPFGPVTLSAAQIEECKKLGAKPEEFAALKAHLNTKK